VAKWTVFLSDRLLLELDETTRRLAKAVEDSQPKGRPAVEAALRRFEEFDTLMGILTSLDAGTTDPADVLKWKAIKSSKSRICLLTVGGWQALFLIDERQHRCGGMFVEEVSPVWGSLRKLFQRPLR